MITLSNQRIDIVTKENKRRTVQVLYIIVSFIPTLKLIVLLFKIIVDTQSMYEAVRYANKIAEKGDTVILSPACASFDLFENYEARGREFKTEVRGL